MRGPDGWASVGAESPCDELARRLQGQAAHERPGGRLRSAGARAPRSEHQDRARSVARPRDRPECGRASCWRRRRRPTLPSGALLPPLLMLSLLLLLLLLLPLLASVAQAFNVDTQTATVYAGPSGSYFGYTVAQHRDRNSNFLLVGAPKAQTSQPGTERAGAVFKCNPMSAANCLPIPVDPNGSSTVTLKNETAQADDKAHQWFGASLGSGADGSIIACAPKYVYFMANMRRRDPVGTCWISRGSFTGFLDYSPCALNDQWGHHHLGSCQAGFSSAITKDGGKVFMGAPGSHVWQGQVFAHNMRSNLQQSTSAVNPRSEDDSYLGYALSLGRFSAHASLPAASPSDSDLAMAMPRGNDLAGKVVLVDRDMKLLQNLTGEQPGSYFGYALATADVNGDGLDDLLIGAPLFYNSTISHKEPHFERGRVYVALQSARHELQLAQRLDGHKNRARFGSALANCGDLNRDGFQDIAVGAPYDGPNQHGAVYIYLGRRGGLSDDYDQVIYAEQLAGGASMRSFGFALSGGLDVDGNAYPDLLVGDYEASRAVLLRARPVVNVSATLNFQPEYFNLDDKTCTLPNSSTSVSCITVTYCIKYSGVNVDPRLGFVYDIKLDTENKGAPRLFFLNNEGKSEDRATSQLTRDSNQCRSFKAYVTRQVRDKLTPLRVEIEYSLADYAGETFDPATGQPKLRPVLNRAGGGGGGAGGSVGASVGASSSVSASQAPNRLSKTASIQKNCGPDNVCVPDLKLSVTPNLDSYTIGSNERLVLDVTVRNAGEDAFESMLYLNMPTTINFIAINKTRPDSPACYAARPDQTGVNVLTCDLGNPMRANDVLKFSVITEPARSNLQFASPDFTFVAQVNSTNPELDDKHREDNQAAIGIPVRVEVQLVLSGNSQPPLIVHNRTQTTSQPQQPTQQVQQQRTSLLASFFGGERPAAAREATQAPSPAKRVSETDVGQEVQHIYQLQNKGPSTISDIALAILWPSKTADGDHLLYLVDEPFTSDKVKCRPAPRDAINPAGLKYLRGDSVTSARAQNSSADAGQRYRRQAAPLASEPSPEPLAQTSSSVDAPIIEQLDVAGCGPSRCTLFECNVYELGHNEIATIRVRSRLDRETISRESMQKFDISSKLVAQVKALPYNVTVQREPYVYKVVTQVATVGMSLQDQLPWWLILGAVLLGILLFILLACFLRYLGFFNRQRKPAGAGASAGAAEREPLTPTIWNDYQYTPGDTAL